MTPANISRKNRLAAETSPYLLQHAHNPVDWYAWGPEALERAAREQRPILLSIGYAACHWCHVMERESFENEEIARLMNDSFVCIKVDREERPDLDEIYMAATVALSGHGGWPMTVFLTPDQRPFFAGTYFPPTEQMGRPGLRELLERVAELWREDRDTLFRQAAELTRAVALQSASPRPGPVGEAMITRAVRELGRAFDQRWGGFSPAPKFPPGSALSLLVRHHVRGGDPDALRMVRVTLDAMKNGGIYDHLAGGFARYSTDERWLVPHFEKMLYDNAQLSRVFLQAYQVTSDPEYARVARETLDYVLREMQGPEGGYYSATDADSEGEEGKFYVWQPREIEAVLGREDAERFCRYYDVTAGGNWEGKSILNTPRALDVVARELGMSSERLADSLSRSRDALYRARKRRVPPLLDDKVLVSWNALAIGAMADGFRVLRERRYLESAVRAGRYVLAFMTRPDGGLHRTSRAGRVHIDAYLEDYAFFTDALLDLYEAGGDPEHLENALALAERMLADFGDPQGGAFFATAADHEPLIVRPREGHDGALPNANAVAAQALARLAAHLGREDLRDRAVRAIRAYGAEIARAPRSYTSALCVADFLLEPPLELAVSGEADDPRCEALWTAVGRQFLPTRVLGHANERARSSSLEHPLVEHKGLVGGRPALFVCRQFTCRAPVTDPAEVSAALQHGRRATAEARLREVATERLPGCATPEATRALATRYAGAHPHGYADFGQTGLRVSRLGFGGYRVEEHERAHREALVAALSNGVNVIDTSTNYTNGGSERLIGEVLSELVRARRLDREGIVVVSKIGYAQGDNLELARQRKLEGRPFPEMVEFAEDTWHSIHPEWLDDQLSRSLARLGLEALDVCLLHNPEYFLSDAMKRGQGSLEELRTEFYRRLERAFRFFEAQVRAGRLRYYGVSSNTVVSPAGEHDATELRRILDAARRAGGDEHRCLVLELPMNLLESGAVFEQNCGSPARSVLECAREARLAVLVNRPLNAITNGTLLRLAEPAALTDAGVDAEPQREIVAELEQEFRMEFAHRLRTTAGGRAPEDLLDWGRRLAQVARDATSLEQWNELELRVIRPQVGRVLETLDAVFARELADAWQAWRARYGEELESLLAALRRRAAERSRARSSVLRSALDPALPDQRREEPLSRLALWTLISTPGVTGVLVGMRRPEYVADALGVLSWATHGQPERLYKALGGVELG